MMLADRRLATAREFRTSHSSSALMFKRSLGRSVLSSLLILHTFIFFLSSPPSSSFSLHNDGFIHSPRSLSFLGVQAALQPGFCGDCQTFSNAISVCGGTFGPADIEINGEYVLQQQYQKCICTDIIRQVLWTCAKCELLAGHASKAPPPTKYQTQCIAWGMTNDEWKQPYTGVVAPGTQTDMGQGPNPSSLPETSSTTNPKPPATSSGATKPSGTGGNGNGGNGDKTSDPATPSSSSDKSTKDDDKDGGSGVNSTAIGISVGIIGVAAVAGIAAVVTMKRRRRRRRELPLDLEPPAALRDYASHGYGGSSAAGAGHDDDKWGDSSTDRYHPSSPTRTAYTSHGRSLSPTMNAASVASATPVVVSGYDGYDVGYDGYDYQHHQQYDRYPAGGPQAHPVSYKGYTESSVGYGHHPQGGYTMQDYGYEHYDQQQQQPQHQQQQHQ